MTLEFDYPAWVLLVIGLYSVSASIGELRHPGFWESMIADLEQRPALRFLTGIICLALGAAIYLVGSWGSADWAVIVVKVIGGWMIAEGALFLAIGDWFMGFSRRLMGMASRLWASLSMLLGLGLIIAAILRI